jgi:hypothetical protein
VQTAACTCCFVINSTTTARQYARSVNYDLRGGALLPSRCLEDPRAARHQQKKDLQNKYYVIPTSHKHLKTGAPK